jgi:serine/threonine protein kinase
VNESQVFANVLKLATPAERAAYLVQACAGSPRLRADVEALLQAHARDPGFLEQPVASLAGTVDQAAASGILEPGRREQADMILAGRYKLLEQIGEGGMGTVWMARQTEPVKRLVAVKLIKAGLGSKAVLARFEAERQALALMDHPNIARVLDAGVAADGGPFFVMELVKGIPLTRFCDEHRLTPRQRLELFVSVCRAVQHAHHKGIIHRDLKPSNILIALCDDRPVPKVIDFGVAKVTGQQLTEQTLHTGFGAVVGTVEYMSPEQASFNQLDVDSRSDVYALGVLLYELLTGTPPFSRKELERAGALEMLRLIREQEPSKPSTKLSTAEGLPTLAANRGTEPRRLTALVRGELDWIVMKALEKDRNRRYETATALARDVERCLNDEPVEACPPSTTYQLRKLLHKHRRSALTAAAFIGLLLAAVVTSTWLAVWATQAEHQARENETRAREEEQKARQSEANLKRTRLQLSQQLALLQRAVERQRAAVAVATSRLIENRILNERFCAVQPSDVRDAQQQLALERAKLTELETEMAYVRERALGRQVMGSEDPRTLKSTSDLADFYERAERWTEAEALYQELLTLLRETAAADDPNLAAALAGMVRSLLGQKQFAEAEGFLRECLTLREKTAPDDWRRHDTMSLLGRSLLGQNDYPSAERLLLNGYRSLKARAKTIPAEEKVCFRRAVQGLVDLYEATGNKDEADRWRKERDDTNKATAEKPSKK